VQALVLLVAVRALQRRDVVLLSFGRVEKLRCALAVRARYAASTVNKRH